MLYITTAKNEKGQEYVFSIGKSDYPPKGAIVVPRIVPTGELVAHYDENWRKKSLSILVSEGHITIPTGYKLGNDEFIEMSLSEKVAAGVEKIPVGMKLEGEAFVSKTLEEHFEDGEISLEEWADVIRNQRDSLFSKTTWLVERYTEQKILGKVTDESEYLKILNYREYLRNVPQEEGFPTTFSTFKTLEDF